jgi:hypothetical protein
MSMDQRFSISHKHAESLETTWGGIMFEYADVSIKVGREATKAGDRVANHYRMIEVLAWLMALHQDAGL